MSGEGVSLFLRKWLAASLSFEPNTEISLKICTQHSVNVASSVVSGKSPCCPPQGRTLVSDSQKPGNADTLKMTSGSWGSSWGEDLLELHWEGMGCGPHRPLSVTSAFLEEGMGGKSHHVKMYSGNSSL